MGAASSQASALSGTWCRLHPLSPLARVGITLGFVVAAVGIPTLSGGQVSSGGWPDLIVVAAIAVLGIGASVVSWLVTRWRVVGDELQIDTGLIYRQSLRFPLRRIQAVDIVAPLTARMLGLAEVRRLSAGTGHNQHGRLAYLTNQDAALVRAQLLALAHGLAAETPRAARPAPLPGRQRAADRGQPAERRVAGGAGPGRRGGCPRRDLVEGRRRRSRGPPPRC